ncbi:hypothetical protein [Alienimonas californiensis]|uniref:Uncharacterized protein n=1 Tax=Alienimonas californiensis TaxID=2527989 RepID=A0A517P8V7_9PLAN|nr:hypothetical protein [Alienimonas californiensis]QDT15792.1 hypothetical protein CA12_18860 [Alienimonas californiensis]
MRSDPFPTELLIQFAFVNLPVAAGLAALLWAALRLWATDRLAAALLGVAAGLVTVESSADFVRELLFWQDPDWRITHWSFHLRHGDWVAPPRLLALAAACGLAAVWRCGRPAPAHPPLRSEDGS